MVRRAVQGRAVQVDPMKSVLKAPGSMLLKLRYDGPLSNFAFKFDLRRYTTDGELLVGRCRWTVSNPVLTAPTVSALETRIS